MKKTQKTLLIFAPVAVAIFLGASLIVREQGSERAFDPGGLRFNVTGPAELNAAENSWGFVRQSATWANANSNAMDSIITSLNSAGFLSLSTGTRHDFTSVNIGGRVFKISLQRGSTFSVASTAYGGTKAFANKLIVWRASDDAKALELFWTSSGTLDTTGALMVYRLYYFNPVSFDQATGIVESYAYLNPSARRSQSYSWDGPLSSSGVSDSGRVSLEEMGSVLCFKSVVQLTSSAVTSLGSPCGGGTYFYMLGYGQKIASPFQTTAKFGLNVGSVSNNGLLCGTANSINYGLFGVNGFVTDSTTSIPSDYPTQSSIDTLFSELGGAGDFDGDDTQTATITALSGNQSTTGVRFRDPDGWSAP